jgi:hypothetical protein
LNEAVDWLEALNSNDEETASIETIQRRLCQNEQKRFDELRDFAVNMAFSAKSRSKNSFAYPDRLEQQNVERQSIILNRCYATLPPSLCFWLNAVDGSDRIPRQNRINSKAVSLTKILW